MRIALKILLVLVSIGLGVISCALGLNILISFGGPKYYNPGPRGIQIFLLSMIIIGYSILLFLLYRNKKNSELAMIALLTFILSIIVTPVISVYSADISRFFRSPPSYKTQMSLQKEIQKIIQENDLPYTLDSKESEKKTKNEYTRTVILLRKKTSDKIQQKEVDLVIKNSPSSALRLTFYDKNQQENVTVILDKDGDIVYCDPLEFCD
ncbi:hypothetical protein M3650_10155 [Paenibacillus sp. MER TA 81-3]|uniref:hypothetical protein n=1 Tax=Paenibacillus sp. MER TA 81-3 TaxID=2939573 RepID=UPI0020416CDD|nr:hypothetical protein [Paenibacillus sp. MER TA 81-3]MCM3338985.1 hypothetical protein [Paenibacillus sp. MER TA 81-3]